MFSAAGKNDSSGGPPLDNAQSNRILLILVGTLVLLLFMDFQARRHFESVAGAPADRLNQSVEALSTIDTQPIRESADEILNGASEMVGEYSGQAGEAARDGIEYAGDAARNGAADAIQGAAAGAGEAAGDLIDAAGQETAGHVRPRNVEALNEVSLRPLDTVTLKDEHIELFFIQFRNGRSRLIRVHRPVPKSAVRDGERITLATVLDLLRRGPELRERGLLNMFDDGIQIRSMRLDNGVLVLDLNDRIGRMGAHVIRDRLDQLLFTVTRFAEVRGVKLLVDGREIHSLGSGKIDVPAVMKPSDRTFYDYEG